MNLRPEYRNLSQLQDQAAVSLSAKQSQLAANQTLVGVGGSLVGWLQRNKDLIWYYSGVTFLNIWGQLVEAGGIATSDMTN